MDSSKEPIHTTGIVCLRDNTVLLLKPGPLSQHTEELWGLPTGRLEADESFAEGAVRELAEETGIIVSPEDIIQIPETFTAKLAHRDGSDVLMYWVVFAIDNVYQEASITDKGIPNWIPLDKVHELLLQKNVAAPISSAYSLLRLSLDSV